MGFFDFVKGGKKSSSSSGSNSTGLNTGNYWIDNVTNLPIDDLLNNRDEDYLKKVLKEDSDIHRRTFALSVLWNIIDKDYDKFSEYFANLAVNLNLDIEDVKEITQDYSDFIDAMEVIKKVVE